MKGLTVSSIIQSGYYTDYLTINECYVRFSVDYEMNTTSTIIFVIDSNLLLNLLSSLGKQTATVSIVLEKCIFNQSTPEIPVKNEHD